MSDLKLIKIPIRPIPKPRMVKSDSYKKRPIVTRYWAFKAELKLACNVQGLKSLPDSVCLGFVIPMPEYWSVKKKKQMLNMPHQQTPDIDNLIKSVLDCLCDDDSYIWHIEATKRWGEKGMIKIVI